VDAAAMINESTFGDVVRGIIGHALDRYDYDMTVDHGFRVRFENPDAFVEVTYDAPRSNEVSIWIGDPASDREPPLELADALRSTECDPNDAESVALMQTTDPAVLTRFLERAAALLCDCAADLLAGDHQAFAEACRRRSRRAVIYTSELSDRRVLDAADAAWAVHDYGQVHDLLNPIRDTLGVAHRRRLKFAERKL
jgi:hypothetical protein